MWKPQPYRPIADWLGRGHVASATRGEKGPSPVSFIFLHIYNSDNPTTKPEFCWADPVPHGVEVLGGYRLAVAHLQSQRHRGRIFPSPVIDGDPVKTVPQTLLLAVLYVTLARGVYLHTKTQGKPI